MPVGERPNELSEQRFSVDFEYPVAFRTRALDPGDATLAWLVARREPARRHPLKVVFDQGLEQARPELRAEILGYAERHADVLELRGEPCSLPAGEACKNDPAIVAGLHAEFAAQRLDRQATVLILGGGAVLDAAGFAASTAHRGIRVVRMPSTVLSQSDGGVGVKTSVNAFSSKNFVGTFAPPFAVLNDADLLRTLPLREARAGMAEAVKVALVKDPAFFQWLEANAQLLGVASPGAVSALVRRAAELHLAHIASAGDPFEMGSARPLDYGHWLAHRLEVASGYELRHGEAVAIGMLLDARYAELSGFLSAAERARISGLLRALGLPRAHAALAEQSAGRFSVLRGLEEFREHLGGQLTITLLAGIGRGFEVNAIDEQRMAGCIEWLLEDRP